MVMVKHPDLALSGGLALNPWSHLTLTDRGARAQWSP